MVAAAYRPNSLVNTERADHLASRFGALVPSPEEAMSSDTRTSTKRDTSRNIFGGKLESCSTKPMTGFFRNGCCDTGSEDAGSHSVCVVVTDEFLKFSKSRGNDLSTPMPEFGFSGLKSGDRWCLCAPRWQEAFKAGQAPRIVLRATHEDALRYCSFTELKRHAIDLA